MIKRITCLLLGFLLTSYAFSCSYCVRDGLVTLFPFLSWGVWVLAAWWLAYQFSSDTVIDKKKFAILVVDGGILLALLYANILLFFIFLVRWFYDMWSYSKRDKKSFINLLLRGAWFLILILAAREAGPFLYLSGSFIITFFTHDLPKIKSSTESWANRLAQNPQVFTVIGAVILVALAAWHYPRFYRMDKLDRVRSYLSTGSGPVYTMLHEVAIDPQFNVSRLEPMLKQRGSKDEHIAYEVLYKRNNPQDLIRFKDIVLTHPKLGKILGSSEFPDQEMYMKMWLDNLLGGYKSIVTTPQDLEKWINEQKP
jgi:hypothetical protein